MLANYGNDRQFFQAETQGEKDSRTDFAINLNDKRQDPRPYCEAARTIGRQLQR